MSKDREDNGMICVGPAGEIRLQAAAVKELLAGVLARLESGDSKNGERVVSDLREAIKRYEWFHKALRGECGMPKRPPRRRPTAAQLDLAERFAREVRNSAVADQDDPPESVH
jgi:predicted polyphosphate/ATP-dependent NAD kinase